MLQPIPIELILAAQQLVTEYGSVDHCLSYSGYLNDGSAYLTLYAKLKRTTYPSVKISVKENEITITVHVLSDTDPMTGLMTQDYKYFLSLTNRVYCPEEFIQACRDFWFNKGKSDLFQ